MRKFQRELATGTKTKNTSLNKAKLPPQIQWHSKPGSEHLAAERHAAEKKAVDQAAASRVGVAKRPNFGEDLTVERTLEPIRAARRRRTSSHSFHPIKEEKDR